MPLWYGSGAVAEHMAVRRTAGIFDISHMGRFRVAGRDAAVLLSNVVSRNAASLAIRASAYALVCNREGGIIDDLMLYRAAEDSFVVICNASNTGRVTALLRSAVADREAVLVDLQPSTVFLAVQGPEAAAAASRALSRNLLAVPRHGCVEVRLQDKVYFCGRTGYTGEDGFEVVAPDSSGGELFRSLVEAEACNPCGLAARDSLRLEAALPLHGADIDESTNPWQAGLGWAVDLDHEFTGSDALRASSGRSTSRLACIVGDEPGVFRHGQAVYQAQEPISSVTSGGFSPMLNRGIGMAYLPRPNAREGTALVVDVRGRRVACHVVKRPFYRSSDLTRRTQEGGFSA
jgi:aminomethyltransferase